MLANTTISNYVSLLDLEFQTACVIDHTTSSVPFERTVRFGMPKIPKDFLRCTVFLYPDKESAIKGENCGGSGFVMGITSAEPDKSYVYFVTNWHVSVQGGSPVVRVNKIGGGYDIFDFDCAEWQFYPHLDIAAIQAKVDLSVHDIVLIPHGALLKKEKFEEFDIGPGDDVFMLGRFMGHDGKDRNLPAARFGHISINPSPILQGNGAYADSYCIDMNSRSGYSGSPVFVYRTPGADLTINQKENKDHRILLAGVNHLSLLGIHWGQFPERWEVRDDGTLKSEDHEAGDLLTGKKYIKGLSGMTCVLPSWAIAEVLDHPTLKRPRDRVDELLRRQSEGKRPETESAVPEPVPDRHFGDEVLEKMLNTPPKPHGDG